MLGLFKNLGCAPLFGVIHLLGTVNPYEFWRDLLPIRREAANEKSGTLFTKKDDFRRTQKKKKCLAFYRC